MLPFKNVLRGADILGQVCDGCNRPIKKRKSGMFAAGELGENGMCYVYHVSCYFASIKNKKKPN